MPSYFMLWTQREDKDTCMYSDLYHFSRRNCLSEWEIGNNPWWIDFPKNSCPSDEQETYKSHSRGTLDPPAVEVEVHNVEVEMGSALETRLNDTDVSLPSNVPRQRFAKSGRKGKEHAGSSLLDPGPSAIQSAKRGREQFEYMPPLPYSVASGSKV